MYAASKVKLYNIAYRESKIRPRHSTYGALINAYAQRGEVDEIDKVLTSVILFYQGIFHVAFNLTQMPNSLLDRVRISLT